MGGLNNHKPEDGQPNKRKNFPVTPDSWDHPATGTKQPQSKEKSKYNGTNRDGLKNRPGPRKTETRDKTIIPDIAVPPTTAAAAVKIMTRATSTIVTLSTAYFRTFPATVNHTTGPHMQPKDSNTTGAATTMSGCCRDKRKRRTCQFGKNF